MNMTAGRIALFGSSAITLWLVGQAPSFAQATSPATEAQKAADQAEPARPAPDVVIVTGSRIMKDGLDAPTPVAVISADQLAASQPQTLIQSLGATPQFRNNASPQSNGPGTQAGSSIGASYLNLRGLGAQRTLVLLDGHRLGPNSFLGSADIGVLPEGVISRVDVVTGGASAAYGSDAVSGVVNFAIDSKYNGLKGLLQGGQSRRGDAGNYKVSLTGGMDLFDGRGHILVSGEEYENDGILDYEDRKWAKAGYAVISVPGVTAATQSPTNPRTIMVPNVRASAGTYGGLITNTALRGTQFLPGGQTAPFNFGTLTSASTQIGGDGVDVSTGLENPQKRENLFARFDYDLTDSIHAYAQVLYGRDKVSFVSGPEFTSRLGQFQIFNDNAFLPASIKTAMTTGNITSFSLGRFGRDIGVATYQNLNRALQYNLGLTGELGGGWTFDAFVSRSDARDTSLIQNQAIVPNMYRAVDAVVSPTTGQIVCRSTLTTPNDGCVPINLFGEGSPSAAAIAYVRGDARAVQDTTQDNVGFSISGEPFALPAGPLSLAIGGEYRRDESVQTRDALSADVISTANIRGIPASLNGRVGLLERTNPPAFSGYHEDYEGFLEVLAPILKDAPFARSLDFNGAIRYTDYNLSGAVTTWKLGVTYEPVSGLKFRGTKSRDIRAPSLFEQFVPFGAAGSGGPITDPFNNNAVVPTIFVNNAGNTSLVPEVADTLSYGFVFRPEWAPKLGLSIDYYKIEIDNAIGQLFAPVPVTNAQLLINQCFAGNAALCGAIHRDVNGAIFAVDDPYFNIAKVRTSGVDFEVNYGVPLPASLDSSLTLRAVASYLHELSSQLPGGLNIDRAGETGQSANGNPHWAGTINATLEHGPLSVIVEERYIAGGKFDNTLGPSDININHADAVYYTNLTLRYRLEPFGHRSELFLTVNNLFDKDPPHIGRFLSFGTIPTNKLLYDQIGQQFTAGIKFEY